MKIPSLLNRRIPRKQKLRATTARRSRGLGFPDQIDYEQMSEPNMKLSRALLIVLLLHVVAVAGIVAFNTIKTRENLPPTTPEAVANTVATPAVAPAPVESAVLADNESALRTAHATTAASAPNEPAKVTTSPEGQAAAASRSSIKDSGKIYTVLKGDNPVTIARRLKVSEADLLALNQISDPRKLQINQKLRIPARAANSAKHSSD